MTMRSSSGGRFGRFFVFLPFSIRCDSESSVALSLNSISHPNNPGDHQKGGDQENQLKMNKSDHNLSKATLISQGLHRLVRRFKSFSQFFVYKEEEEMEKEKEMEIGYPTDVKHVTHIGTDGSTIINNNHLSTNWKPTHHDHHQLLAFPSLSIHQFELAMAAQSQLPPST